MQSSLWSNSSSVLPHQQQQQQHQQRQLESPTASHNKDVCPHLKVMRSSDQQLRRDDEAETTRLPPAGVRTPPPKIGDSGGGISAAARLATSGSFPAASDEDAPAAASAFASFPLLSVLPVNPLPLVTRQQRYLQQQQQQLLLQEQEHQHQHLQEEEPHECHGHHRLSSESAANAVLHQLIKRKRFRHRVLIMVYLTCMLLFVMAIVFLAALGVFHTAGSAGGDATVASQAAVSTGVRQGTSP